MFYWKAFALGTGELIAQAPITVQNAEGLCIRTATIEKVGIYKDDLFLLSVELSTQQSVTEGDYFKLSFADETHIHLMGLALRIPSKRVASAVYSIQQASEMTIAYQTGNPVHYLCAQALESGCVPDEKQQSLRWWNPGLLVQRVKERLMG